jgi:hypothetical protein
MSASETRTSRSGFLKYGAGGLASAGLAGAGLSRWAFPAPAQTLEAGDGFLELFINEGYAAMVDGTPVYMRGFGDQPTSLLGSPTSLTHAPRVFLKSAITPGLQVIPEHPDDPDGVCFPLDASIPPLHTEPDPQDPNRLITRRECPPNGGHATDEPHAAKTFWRNHLHKIRRKTWTSFWPRRTIIAEQGAEIRLRITNNVSQSHSLQILGTTHTTISIAKDEHADFVIAADQLAPGEYILTADHTVDPATLPAALRRTCDPASQVPLRAIGLYDVLVVVPSGRDNWWTLDGKGPEFEREFLWIMADVIDLSVPDPNPSGCATFTPRYFTINDRSGVYSVAHSEDTTSNRRAFDDTKPYGYIRDFSVRDDLEPGQLIRMVNTGIAVHQPHFHGNHVRLLAHNCERMDRAEPKLVNGSLEFEMWKDVVRMEPLDRKDVMLPVKAPPDSVVLPHQIGPHSADAVQPREEFPEWDYPMHRHDEMSQTAAGGLYPNGALSDWVAKP